VATIAAKRTVSPVNVHTVGGTQKVRWNGGVYLTGAAVLVFDGEFFV